MRLPGYNPGFGAWDGNGFVSAALEPPNYTAKNHQADRDQLGSAHEAAEYYAAAGIAAQELEEEAGHTVEHEISGEDLAIELLALQHPHQQEKVRQLYRELEKLGGLEGYVQGGLYQIVGHRIRNPLWLTLLALVLGEKLMGLPGMVLAPVILNYVKMEASRMPVEDTVNIERSLKSEV